MSALQFYCVSVCLCYGILQGFGAFSCLLAAKKWFSEVDVLIHDKHINQKPVRAVSNVSQYISMFMFSHDNVGHSDIWGDNLKIKMSKCGLVPQEFINEKCVWHSLTDFS